MTSEKPNKFQVDTLESRTLLSGFGHFGGFGGDFGGGFGGGFGMFEHGDFEGAGRMLTTIQFNQTPAAVQTGLTTLANTDKLTAPTATQTVFLSNINGVESYTIDITSTGTDSRLTVDQTGAPVTAPTQSTTTWATLNGTGAGADAAAAKEITAIAAALGLIAPTDATVINVSTPATGAATYTVWLSNSSKTWWRRGTLVSVDANGNPVGDQNLPFSVIPTAIQSALNSNAPTGATPIAADSTQMVRVQTIDGVTLYSTNFTTSGTTTTITVNLAGKLANLPTHTTSTFGALSSDLQTALQTLATDAGATTKIDPSTSVDVLTEVNGTTLYSVKVGVSATSPRGNTYTRNVTITVDSSGNPTTLPSQGIGEGQHRGFGFAFGPPGFGIGFGGGDDDSGTGSGSNNGGSSSGNSGNSSGATTTTTTTAAPSSTSAGISVKSAVKTGRHRGHHKRR